MARICMVCPNRSTDTEKQYGDQLERVTYHKFPAPGDRCNEWLKFLDIPQYDQVKNKFICSEHFADECLERDLRSELLSGVKRMILKKTAVPSILRPKRPTKRVCRQQEEAERKKRKEEVQKLLTGEIKPPEPIRNPFRKRELKKTDSDESDPLDTMEKGRLRKIRPAVLQEKMKVYPQMTEVEMMQKIATLEKKNREQQAKICRLERSIEWRDEKISLAKAEMLNISSALDNLKDMENINVNVRVTEVLRAVFSDAQMHIVLNDGQEAPWNVDEMFLALRLRCISIEAFDFLRNNYRYPLPSAEAMESWIHEMYLEMGMNRASLRLLEHFTDSLPDPVSRVCALVISRTRVKTKYHYDPDRDQVIGGDSQLYCICAQGLFYQWKQIVRVEFDFVYSLESLLKLVEEMHYAGYQVIAVVIICDEHLAETLSELDVTADQHYVQHPVTVEPVYLLACPASVLTLIHRIIIDNGFVMQEDNVTITKTSLEKLLSSADPRIVNELKFDHRSLNKDMLREHNSSVTKDLFSRSTVKALKCLAEEGEETVAALATLVDLFCDWYDICTVKMNAPETYTENVITRLPYGHCNGEDDQNIVLDAMFDTMESLVCVNEGNSLQEVLLMSINSLRKMLIDLRKQFDTIESIPTMRLTTFALEETLQAFQKSHRSSPICSIEETLWQLSLAVAKEGTATVSNMVIEQATLRSDVRPICRSEPPVDSELEDVSEEDACTFLTEYIAKTLKHQYDYLGEQKFAVERKNQVYVLVPEPRNSGMMPSRLWTEQAKKLELYVSDINFYRNDNIVENLINSIHKCHPKMGIEIVSMYVKKRLAIKLINLNKELEQK